MTLQPKSFLKYLNPDGGLPYTPGAPSFSEPTLLMLLAFISAEQIREGEPLSQWALTNQNKNGSIGLTPDFPNEGLWNTPLLAIAMHHLGFQTERDSAIGFILNFYSIRLQASAENDLDARLVGWPWVPHTFGWVEPTSWALLSLALAGKSDHPRALEGRRLLENRCIPGGGWNYGNKVVFDQKLMPFWDTTALALLALGDTNPELTDRNLDLLERSLPEIQSLLSAALVSICFSRFNRDSEKLRDRIVSMLQTQKMDRNLANSALGLIALSPRRVFTQ